jgi:hypothetical protein
MTAGQYRAMIDAQRILVERGYHPADAGAIVRRAARRTTACCGSCADGGSCGGGLGVQQMRSLRRDLDPTIAPRPVIAGEQCVRIQEIPGNETVMYRKIEDYRNRGWNVMEVSRTKGFPSSAVYWACPPGQLPRESQGQILASQLGATTAPATTAPATTAPAGSPSILSDISAAGDDPSIAAARNVVSKWSWIIPVGGLLMSLKQKVSAFRSPTSAAMVGMGRRR